MMKMRSTILIGMVCLGVLAGCRPASEPAAQPTDEVRARISFEAALQSLRPEEQVKVPRSQCPICKGTGKVKAGDTVTVVWRECDNCVAEPGETPGCSCPICPCREGGVCTCAPCECDDCPCQGLRRRVLVFTANWCQTCQEMKSAFAALKSTGWRIGGEAGNHFQLIDFDAHPELAEKFSVESLPTLVTLVDGVEVARHVGKLDQWQLGELYNAPADEPAEEFGAIRFGTLAGLEPQIAHLKRALALLGGDGVLEIKADRASTVDFPVSATTSVRLATPFRMRYAIRGDVVSLLFETPTPVRYRFLRGQLTELEITADRINVKIKGLPDGFFVI